MSNISSMRRALEAYEFTNPESLMGRSLKAGVLAGEVRSFLENLTRENLNEMVSRAIYGEERVTIGVDRIVNGLLDIFEGVGDVK